MRASPHEAYPVLPYLTFMTPRPCSPTLEWGGRPLASVLSLGTFLEHACILLSAEVSGKTKLKLQ